MSAKQQKHVLMGLPESGKTTFLAALYYLVEAGDVVGALKLAETHGDQTYLNRISMKWGNGEALGRTLREEETTSTLRLEDPDGSIVELAFPDLNGESFADQWIYRRCRKECFEAAAGANGALLFVHPDKVIEPEWIERRNALAAAASQAIGESPAAAAESQALQEEDIKKQSTPWDAKKSPTQVQLVELLQFLTKPPFAHASIRLAIVVSAWDRVTGLYADANVWLQKRLPLLHQFLESNAAMFPSRIFGVSAQGGPLGDPEILKKPASQRIKVVGVDCHVNDITAPVRWLMTSGRGGTALA